MKPQWKYTIFKTDAGWLCIVGSSEGIRRVTLPRQSCQEAFMEAGEEIKYATQSSRAFKDLAARFSLYYRGGNTKFPDRLDLTGATLFQRKVWQATRLISYGETRSYAWVANRINNPKAVRASGQALGKNPLPVIVPCHRVISSDGKLGGFSGGLDMKRRLLSLEGITGFSIK